MQTKRVEKLNLIIKKIDQNSDFLRKFKIHYLKNELWIFNTFSLFLVEILLGTIDTRIQNDLKFNL